MLDNKELTISMIVAMAENHVIGRNNQLPWYLPNDLKYFKATTMGKPIVMGRKTFDSIGKPLPGRTNIVVTANPEFSASGVVLANSVDEALEKAVDVALIDGSAEVMVIGGARLYSEFLPKVDKLYLTKVHAHVEGDAEFPQINWAEWELVSKEDYSAKDANPYDYSFCIYQRIG